MTGSRTEQKDLTFMAIASTLSWLGTCDRKHVGAVIVREGRCVTWGYNGAPQGLPHCSENFHGWSGQLDSQKTAQLLGLAVGDFIPDEAVKAFGCRNATHAEANALAFAARQGISTDGGTLYVTLSPCDVCARLLIAAGIIAVHYSEVYRDPTGGELLERAGVSVAQL